MKLKTYHSESVEAAMRLAAIELGEEAIFVGSREANPQNGEDRHVKVTFALLENRKTTEQRTGAAVSSPGSHQNFSTKAATKPDSSEQPPGEDGAGPSSVASYSNGQPANDRPTRPKMNRPHWKKFVPPGLNSDSAAAEETGNVESSSEKANGSIPSIRLPATHESRTIGRPVAGLQADHPAPVKKDQAESGGAAQTELVEQSSSEGSKNSSRAAATSIWKALTGRSTGKTEQLANAKDQDSQGEQLEGPPAGDTGAPLEREVVDRNAGRELITCMERTYGEINSLRLLLQSLVHTISLPTLPDPAVLRNPALAKLLARLFESELEPAVLQRLILALPPDHLRVSSPEEIESRIREQIERLCRTAPGLGLNGQDTKLAAFVGPSGSGKTTTIVKLAVWHSWTQGHRVHLISVQPHQVGGRQVLAAYAQLAGIPLTNVDGVDKLAELLKSLTETTDSHPPKLVLIDTPGYCGSEEGEAEELARALSTNRSMDIHLVLDLSTRTPDLRRAMNFYEIFRPAKLLFSKLDQTAAHGNLINESIHRLPLSFLSKGTRIPEDIVPADKRWIADLILKGEPDALEPYVSETHTVI